MRGTAYGLFDQPNDGEMSHGYWLATAIKIDDSDYSYLPASGEESNAIMAERYQTTGLRPVIVLNPDADLEVVEN